MILDDDFGIYMNKPETVNVKVEIEDGYVICPFCKKKLFKVWSDTRISNLPYKCKGSNCKKEFVINL